MHLIWGRLRAVSLMAVALSVLPMGASLSAGACAPRSQTTFYHVKKKVWFHGEGASHQIALDGAGRIYIVRNQSILVVSADTGTLLGEVSPLHGGGAIALAPDLGRGFVANRISSTVTVFDLKSLKVLAEVKTGGIDPVALIYDRVSRRAIVFNRGSENATAIDARTAAVVGGVQLGAQPDCAAAEVGVTSTSLSISGQVP